MTAADYLSNLPANAAGGPVEILDTAANIAGALDQLQANLNPISSIVLSDGDTLSLSASQLGDDSVALSLVQPATSGPVDFDITDTAANLSAALGAIETLEGQANSSVAATVSDNAALTLTASQFLADAKALASSVNANGEPLQIDIVDAASNISDDFVALAAADSDIAAITISDNAALALTPSEVANDGGAIALLQNAGGGAVNLGPFAHQIRVDDFLANAASYSARSQAVISDSAAQISKNLDTLQADAADIASLTISDDDALTLTAKDFAANAALLGSTTPLNGGPLQVDIVDSAAGVQSEFDALAAAGSEVAAITVSGGGTVTLGALQIANDASLLALMKTPFGVAVPVAVADNGADILNNLDALAAIAAQISAITISDSSQLPLTAAEAANDLPALALLKNANGKPAVLSVSDSAANIQANLAALQTASGDLSAIIVDDSLPLTLTAAEAADDSVALSSLKNSDGSSVAFAVSDFTDDILAHLGALQADAAEVSSLIDIGLSGADDTIFVSLAPFAADGPILARIVSADPAPVPAKIDISDTAATLSANIDALDDDLSTGRIAGLQQSDLGGDDDIVVTAAQFARDAKAIAALSSAGARFAIVDSAGGLAAALPALASGGDLSLVNNLTVARNAPLLLSAAEFGGDDIVSTLQTLETVDAALQPSVSDTAADLSAAMDTLQGEISSLNAIYVSNNRAVTLTASQIGADQGAIQLLQNQDDLLPLAIDVSDTAANIVDDFATLASLNVNGVNPIAAISASGGGIVTLTAGDVISGARLVGEIQGASAIDVADTADDILKALPELLADIKSIGAIAITDGDDLVLSKSLQTKYANVIAKLPKNSVTTLPEISWATYQTDGTANKVPASFAIDDTASAIEANIAALSGGLSGLAYIEVKSGALQFTATQVDDDATTLGAIQTTTGATAGFSVIDTAANIVKALGALESLNSQITSITVTGGGALEGLTTADIADDYPVLHRIAAKADVSDSADDIVGDFTALEKDSGQISSIAVTGGGTLTLSASEVEGAQATLNALYAGDETITFAVSDAGLAIAAALDALQSNLAHISSISANDGDDAYAITAEQFAKDAKAIALIQKDDPQATFTLSDVAADISTYLGQLGAATKITISDSKPIAVTLAQVSSDSSEIAALVNQDGSPVVLDVTDTAADIAAAAGSLATLPPGSQITVRDDAGAILDRAAALGTIATLVAIDASGTAAEIVADANGILAVAPNASTTHSFVMTDTAAHIEVSLDALAGVKGLAAVTVSDGAPVVVDIAQLVADAPVVALIEASDPQGRPLKLVDSYSHADSTAGLAALEAAASHISSVTLTGPKPTAPFSAAAFKADQSALDDIGAAAKSLSIADAAAGILGDMSALRTDTTVTSIAVVDTSADIAASFDLLDDALKVSAATAGGNSIRSMTISDNAPVTLNVAQLGDSLALARLKDANGKPYKLAIVDTSTDLTNGAHALNAAASHIASERVTATVAGIGTSDLYFQAHKSSKLVGVEVQDTVAHIEAGLSAMAPYVPDIAIDATDAPVNVAFSAFQANASVLNDVIGGFDITDTTANLGATSAATATALGLLQADLSHIDRLALTGSLTGLSAATAIANAGVLSDVSGGFSIADSAANLGSNLGKLASASDIGKLSGIDVSGGSILIVSTATAVADEKALLKVMNGFSVKGSAAAVARDADVLEAEVVNISTIAVTGSGKLTVTAAVAARDNRALSLAGTYAVSDSGANITSNLAALLPDAANISAISLLSGEVDVSVATLAADAALLAKIAGGVVVSDSGSNIAAALSALATDVTSKLVSHIAIAAPAGGGTAYLETAAANDASGAADAAAIAAIKGPYILELTRNGAIVSQTGDAAGLTFVDFGGSETLTGGGGGETFQLNSGFGAAEITDLYKYASGKTHDTIAFADFSNFSAMTSAATTSNGNVVITAGNGDRLTLDHMTLARLKRDSADFTFG